MGQKLDGGGPASGTLTSSLPLGKWNDVIVHVRLSRARQGLLEAWFNESSRGTPTVRVADVNVGTGCWEEGDRLRHGLYPKFGMYCWDAGNFTPGEVRTAYWDEVRWVDGDPPDAWDRVRPGRE